MSKLIQILSDKANWGRIVFFVIFIVLCFVYGLNKTMFGRPQSIHIWRQTNSLSVALNYYEHDDPLLEPQIHNKFCDNGMSGKTASEFPLIYWGVAQLWKVFGVHEWIFRMVQLIILFLGLFALFEISKYFLKNQFWSGFVSLLLFTSPMFVFYGVNFLPDGPSLAFLFIGWFYVLQFHRKQKNWLLWIAGFFFTFAIVIKITVAISIIAFAGWVFFEWIFQKKEKRIIDYGYLQVLPFIAVIVLSLAWYLYVNHFNSVHKGEISDFQYYRNYTATELKLKVKSVPG